MPCSEKRARLLLARGRARVHRIVPFVIRLVDRERATAAVQPMRIKLDPGSKTTGLALVREDPAGAVHHVLALAAIKHRGPAIRQALLQRRGYRRRRRSANLRYRAPRFDNRTRPGGWLAPSLQHRVDTTLAWVRRLCPKTHTLDAAGVGMVERVTGWAIPTLTIRCTGRGAYQRTRVTQDGFPRGYLMRHKQVRGFQTGDLVRATVPSGKRAGVHIGRVAVRATGSFNIQTPQGVVQGVGYRHCCVIQRGDGYGYAQVGTMVGAASRERLPGTDPWLLHAEGNGRDGPVCRCRQVARARHLRPLHGQRDHGRRGP